MDNFNNGNYMIKLKNDIKLTNIILNFDKNISNNAYLDIYFFYKNKKIMFEIKKCAELYEQNFWDGENWQKLKNNYLNNSDIEIILKNKAVKKYYKYFLKC